MTPDYLTHDISPSDNPLNHLAREWLLTNGTGAFSMGTLPGANTRRYHGLLVGATRPPVGRVVALNQMLEQAFIGGQRVEFTTCLFRGEAKDGAAGANAPVLAPAGCAMLRRFQRGLTVSWTYEHPLVSLTRELCLHWKQQAATIRYRVTVKNPGTGKNPATGVAGRSSVTQLSQESPATPVAGRPAATAPKSSTPNSKLQTPNPAPQTPNSASQTPNLLRLSPMVSLRDFHALLHRDQGGTLIAAAGADSVTLRRDQLAVTVRCAGSRFVSEPNWWYALHYPAETERGQDDNEDCLVPGYFELPLNAGGTTEIVVTAALGEQAAPPGDESPRAKHLAPIVERLSTLAHSPFGRGRGEGTVGVQGSPSAPAINALNAIRPGAVTTSARATPGRGHAADPADLAGHESPHPSPLPKGEGAGLLATLFAIATDDFVVDRFFQGQKLATVIAGYPWFSDWGRDTFIAAPGLLLAAGRYDDARSCSRAFANVIRDGLVPNVFSDYDDSAAQYNTVDASLWYVHTAMEYVTASGDDASWREWIAPACISVIEAYIKGTSAAEGATIRMTGDGLITAGHVGTQLTWMDAACGGVVFTPRHGKAVEINALWYHVLTGMSQMLEKQGDKQRSQHYGKLTGRIERSFAKVFWDEKLNYLCDHVCTDDAGEDHRDTSLRPNQIFAASLPNSPIPRTRQLDVLKAVKDNLLTPMGLWTLPPSDPKYHAKYTGPQMQRDEAYHQGTIWPWLIGPYAEAVLRVGKFSDKAKAEAKAALEPLLMQLMNSPAGGIGQLNEIYEAQEPHRPVGTIAQGWSVSELLRVLRMC